MHFSYKQILRVVLPLIVSGIGQSIIYVTDILFLGRLGRVALGASAIAGLFYASVMMIGFGISSGLQVIIAQKTGERKQEETHKYLLNGIFLQGLIALVFIAFYFLTHHLLIETFVSDEALKEATNTFLNARIVGLFPYFIFYAYRSYYLGVGQTRIISVVTIVMSVLNLLFNPLLIYGWQGIISPFDYVGSAWASVIAEWITMFLIMIFHAYGGKSVRFILWLKTLIWREILAISLPLIFQHFVSVFAWFLFFVFIEKMGAIALAVSNVVRAVYILIMAPVLAFSHSTITIVGQVYGAKEFLELKNILFRIINMSVLFTLPFSVITFFYPEWLMKIFTDDVLLLHQGRYVMQIISFALLCFAVSLPILSAVIGLGETRKVLLIEGISFVIYVSSSALLIFVWHLSLPLVWCNEFVYFACICFLAYFFFEKKLRTLLHQNNQVKV